MSSSKVWVNQEFVDQRKRKKRNKKVRYYVSREQAKVAKEAPNTINKATKASHEYKKQITEGNPNLLDTLGRLSTMAQQLDLVKIRNQLTEINQIVEQVNGVIKGFQDHSRSSNSNSSGNSNNYTYQFPYTQQQPMYPQHNHGFQPPYSKQHPYSSYRPR